MCRRNVGFQRTLERLLTSIMFVGLANPFLQVSDATEVLLDDFEDGSFEDGTPGHWRASLLFDDNVPATVYIENGALVLDSIEDNAHIKAELRRVGSTDGPLLASSDKWSIRSEFRIVENLAEGGLILAGLGTTAFQSAFLGVSGRFGVGQEFNVNSIQTDFGDVLDRDFVIQLDIEERLLTGTIWPLDDPQNMWSVEFMDTQSRQSRPLVYNRRTVAAYDYIQVASETIPLPSTCMIGDFDCDGFIGLTDVDALSTAIQSGEFNAKFDLDESGDLDVKDLQNFIQDIKHTWIGDANFDGLFNSGDLVAVFQKGEYEDGISVNSTWATGDWNSDGEFDTGDFVAAFQGGGFEAGPRPAVIAVPEPSTISLASFGLLLIRRRKNRIWRSSQRTARSLQVNPSLLTIDRSVAVRPQNLKVTMVYCVVVVVFTAILTGTADGASITMPIGLNPGDEYRIAFVTSTTRDATSANINDYNEFVTVAATADGTLTSQLNTTWMAIASTIGGGDAGPIDARDNTMTNPNVDGPGVPIFLQDGITKIADNYEDLWDGSIAAAILGESQMSPIGVWTGTKDDGTEFYGLGGERVVIGHEEIANHYSWIAFCCISDDDDLLVESITHHRLYGISGVVKVVPEPTSWTVLLTCFVPLINMRLNS